MFPRAFSLSQIRDVDIDAGIVGDRPGQPRHHRHLFPQELFPPLVDQILSGRREKKISGGGLDWRRLPRGVHVLWLHYNVSN